MKLRNKSGHTLSFDVDGVKYGAAPHGPIVPDIPLHKVAGVLKLSGLPVEPHVEETAKPVVSAPVAKPEPESTPAPENRNQGGGQNGNGGNGNQNRRG